MLLSIDRLKIYFIGLKMDDKVCLITSEGITPKPFFVFKVLRVLFNSHLLQVSLLRMGNHHVKSFQN